MLNQASQQHFDESECFYGKVLSVCLASVMTIFSIVIFDYLIAIG